MVLVFDSSGSQSLTNAGGETNLFASQTILQHYSTKIFFDEMVANDVIILRVYDYDEDDAVEKVYRTVTLEGVQDDPEVMINWIPSSSYRVTCELTSATSRTVTWALYTA